ncbi:MAG: CotH kinase family protein [Verrucomicrobiota bacterium]|nr:CotH kinase family protein [Verrucomicrobiota bacterium]
MPRISYNTPHAAKHAGRLAVLAALMVGGGCLIQRWGALQPIRSKLQATGFRLGDQDVTKLHHLLLERGLLDLDERLTPASTRAISLQAVRDGLPTFSIVSDEEGLYSPERGIFPHAIEKGRRWERPATMSYFENGELRYETHAGLRIHGGQSRKAELKSFQILFRRSYAGKPRATPGIFFGGEGPAVQRIVLTNTRRPKRFLNPLACEIAASAGCITSRHQPVRVFLNGERVPCGYFMIEHQSREFLKHRYGHDDFEWVRLKGETPPSLSFDLLSSWVNLGRDFVTMRRTAERFDIDNLCAWIFAISFCDTLDEDQGGYFKGNRQPNDLWRCLTWDMDGSFRNGDRVKEQEFDFERLRGLRARLFRRMVENDSEFRAYYRAFAERMLRERITPERLRALVAKYRALAGTDVFVHERADLRKALDGTERTLLERHSMYLAKLDSFMKKKAEEND